MPAWRPFRLPLPAGRILVAAQLVVAFTACSSLQPVAPLPIDDALGGPAERTLLAPRGDGPFGTWLGLGLSHPPAERLRQAIEARLGTALRHRGEAHVTVVTPPEYRRALAAFLPIERLEDIAERGGLLTAAIRPRCVGRVSAELDGRTERAYFVVVDAPDLVSVRRGIHRALVAAGGDPASFDPEAFRPHITLGFTRRDLHDADGADKGPGSCWAPLKAR